jgi:carbon-monoxide dehydrogenase large subunit
MGARWFGARVPRLEDPALLAGRGRYVDDIRLPGMLETAFVRSTVAHALIRRVDTQRAAALDGVVAVWTMADFGLIFGAKRMPMPFPHPALKQVRTQYPLAQREVCYVGEAIAIVLAENRYVAEDAAALVEIEYEALPVVADCRTALDPASPRAHQGAPDNLVARVATSWGDVEAAFRGAPHVFREAIATHRGGCHAMECRGTIAAYDPLADQLSLWSSTQAPYQLRRHLAAYLGREETRLRVAAPDVGGGFGPKAGFYVEDVAVALAAMKAGRPVKWIEDRREHFLATNQQRDQLFDLEIAVETDGRIRGIRGTSLTDNGAHIPYGLVLTMTGLTLLPGPYVVPACSYAVDIVFTNKVPTSPVRGAARPNAVFAMERLIERVARELKIDPAELRRRNFVPKDAFPYAPGPKGRDGQPLQYDSGDYEACLDRALELADYRGFAQRREAAAREGRSRGIGVASYVEDTGVAPFEGATVRVLPSGRAVVVTGAASQGQGLKTVLAQIAADQLGLTPEQIEVRTADTGEFPLGVGTIASRVAVTAGSSTHLAATELRAKVLKLAAHRLEAAEADLELEGGVARVKGVPEMKVGLGELAASMSGAVGVPTPLGLAPGLEATSYHNVTRSTYAAGTNVAEVEVDAETGAVTLLRYSVAHDCGRLINPLIVDGQIEGGVVHGIGNALFEEMLFDENAQPLTTNYGEYYLPLASEMPPIAVEHLETPSPLNPIGVKGAGEGGTLPAAAAVIAAVENALLALGLTLSEHPISPQKLLAKIGAAKRDGTRS